MGRVFPPERLPSDMVSVLVVAAGLPFVLVGGVLLWYGGRLAIGLYRRHRQTRTVDAEVIEASVREVEDGVFEPRVRYRYHFDGDRYESDRLREGRDPPSGSRSVAESVVEDYREGQTVAATFLSGTPGEASLEQVTDTWPYVVAGTATLLGSVFASLGVGIVASGLLG
jgi:hypothetical protein